MPSWCRRPTVDRCACGSSAGRCCRRSRSTGATGSVRAPRSPRGAMRAVNPAVGPSFFLINLRPGVARSTVNSRYADTASARGPQRPADILSYSAVRTTPLLLAGLLGLLGIGVLAHLLITSIRARRHDLAILKTLGLGRRQVGAVVAGRRRALPRSRWRSASPSASSPAVGSGKASPTPSASTKSLVVPGRRSLFTVALVIANLDRCTPGTRARPAPRPALVLRSE